MSIEVTRDAWRSGRIVVTGWTTPDGEAPAGYAVEYYWDETGRYLGPDRYGIEPLWGPGEEDEPEDDAAWAAADAAREAALAAYAAEYADRAAWHAAGDATKED